MSTSRKSEPKTKKQYNIWSVEYLWCLLYQYIIYTDDDADSIYFNKNANVIMINIEHLET